VYYPFVKRIVDIIGSLVGLFFFTLSFPFVGLLIKFETRGSILVKLERVSEGRVVQVYKFRSMVQGAHTLKPSLQHLNERGDGPFFKIKDDPRLTRIGKLIRKFRIDEFPQFINVFKGELSLVGPRPHEPNEVQSYPSEFQPLLEARAGITGLSQVSGASSLPFLKELELDQYYLLHQSFWLDLKIMAKTIGILFFDPTAV